MRRVHRVRSLPLHTRPAAPANDRAEPAAPARRIHWDRLPIAIVGWALIGLWWAAGGKYTIDGLPLLLNTIADFFHAPAQLLPISDWHWYLWLAWLPILISYVERRNRPRRGLVWSGTMAAALLVWLIVSALDGGSTWLAVTHPRPTDWLLARQVAAIKPLAALWTAATTFLPEYAAVLLWRYLRG